MSSPIDASAHLDALCAFAADTTLPRLPPDIVKTAKSCLLYGLSVGIGTRHARPAVLAVAASHASEAGHDGPATRLLDRTRTSAGNAVFANAVLLSGRVQGDSHLSGHLGGIIIPSALAAVEQSGGTGSDLLQAIVSGYEAGLRIGRDHASDLTRRGFRTTPYYGMFGACVAVARARRLAAPQIRTCIGLAVNFVGGLREYVDAGTEESPFQAGFAARNAVYVADLVGLGLEASPSSLYSPMGFYGAYGDPQRDDYALRLGEELGRHFEISRLTVKRYPACQFVRAVIRGLGELKQKAPGREAHRIVLRLHPYEANFIGMRFAGPFHSSAQTTMSAPFCASLAWLHTAVTYQGLRDFDDAAVNALAQRVEVIADETLALYEPVVKVVLADGQTLEWTERADAADDRMSWSAAVAMTYQFFDEVGVPRSLADELIDGVDGIDRSSTVGSLVEKVCRSTMFASQSH